MVDPERLVMISALQHLLFCPRQCALIHLDHRWRENYLTVTGKLLHQRVDRPGKRHDPGCRREYALALRSEKLALTGVADLVEFRRDASGRQQPLPVEYKRGRPKSHRADEVQLCAQAICLEEMLHCSIPRGYLYYGAEESRTEVVFDTELRDLTAETAAAVHRLLDRGDLPPPRPDRRSCRNCSLIDECGPADPVDCRAYLESIE